MKTLNIFLAFVFILAGGELWCQEATYQHFPMQVSFVYPVGLHGTRSADYTYDFSLNMLTGNTGNIDGFEIGGLLNTNQGNMSGVQIAGLGNMTKGNVDGLQIGGLYSLADSVDGLQLNGIFSKSGELDGLQISGIFNLSASSESSIAGIANINAGDQNGIQLAGIYNQAKKLNGVQIGLVNIVDTIGSGIPIGLINLVRKGAYDEWNFFIADYANMGISYKLGIKQFYTIYSVGMNFFEDQLWVAGLGFGHLSEVNPKFSLQPEIICYTYFPMDFQRHIRDTYVYHFKFGLVRNFDERLAVSFAPSIYVAHKSNRQRYDQYGYEQSPIGEIFDVHPTRSSKLEWGLGLSLGVQFR